MPYKEEPLPLQCPPEHAVEDEITEAYRMVYADPPVDKDFWSKRALGEDMIGTDECGHASCSMYGKKRMAVRLAEMPKPRGRGAMVAEVKIPAGSGKWTKNKKSHIHFWMYNEFTPATAFVKMVTF